MAPPDLTGFGPPTGPPATAPVEPPPEAFVDGWAAAPVEPPPEAFVAGWAAAPIEPPVEPPPESFVDGWAAPVEPPVEPPAAFGQGVGAGFAVGPDPRSHGFGPPTGPPSSGVDAPPPGAIPPPPPRSKRALAPIVGAVLYGLFRVGLVVLNITSQDDGYHPATAPIPSVVVPIDHGDGAPADDASTDPSSNAQADPAIAVCYSEGQQEVLPCSAPHDGQIVAHVQQPGTEGADEAFLRCLTAVVEVVGELPADTEVRAYPQGSGSNGPRQVQCGLEAVEGSAPLMGEIA